MNPSPDHQVASWDREYAGGRYRDESPVAFVADILAAARRAGLTSGLYIGCGNGRNYEPLVRGGLDLTGLDISGVALRQLSARMPERRGSLVRGDLSALPEETRYGVVIGIQVFQHGDAEAAHAHLAAARRIRAGAGAAGPGHLAAAPRGRPVDPVGRHLACDRLRPGHAPGEHPCAARADLATMSESDGRPVTQPRDRATGGR